MYKELIISSVIVVLVLGFNYITQKYTQESVDTMKQKLSILREEIREEDIDSSKIETSLKEASNNWENRKNILAYYIEHDEIEKVETHLTMLESNIEVEDYDHALGELDSCSFVLEHIQDKESLNLRNIF